MTAGRFSLVLPYRERAAVALAAARGEDRLEVVAPRAGSRVTRALRRGAERLLPHRYELLPMHLDKAAFARRAAGRLDGNAGVVAFPGAALEPFAVAGGTRVLHAVDAHPRAHNAHLERAFGPRAAAERYPAWLVDRIERELDLADLVLAPSRLVAGQMARHGVDSAKVRVRPYGAEFDLFAPRDAPRRATTRPRVLFVGQVSLRKGIPYLLAASRGVGVEVRVVGNVFDRALLGYLPPEVVVLPPLPHAALREEYAAADAFVLPTIEDACALVTFEAAAAGLPIITTAMNGAAELLGAYPVTTVPVGDVDALARALRSVTPLEPGSRLANAAAARRAVPDWRSYAESAWAAIEGPDD